MENIDNFLEDSTDSSSESSTEFNNNFLNNLELEYYPEPFKTLGSFILSATVGIMTSHILNKQNLENITELYFKYCKNTENDNYIDELIKKINLENNLDKINIILDRSKRLTYKYIDNLINNDYSNLELNKLNIKLIADTLKLIKYDEINKLFI